MYDPLIVDKFIEAQQQLSQIAETSAADSEAMETIATKLRVAPEPEAAPPIGVDDRLPLKALSLLRSIKPSPAGTSISDLGVLISSHLAKIANFAAVALYTLNENQHSIRCRFADGPLNALLESPEIPLGEKLSGWVAAHRTPIWNSDATLDLPSEMARKAGVSLGSSVPLIDGETLIGVLTFYSPAGTEIRLEQRVLVQAIAPSLATVLSASIAHDEVAAVDGSDQRDREVLYALMDVLLSSRTRPSHPDRLAIVRVKWHVDPSVPEQYESMRATLERAVATATNTTGHVVRLGPNDVLIAAAQKHLVAAGLAPTQETRARRATDIEVTEIANSLQLREILGLTTANEQPLIEGRPSIH